MKLGRKLLFCSLFLSIYLYQLIGIMVRVFTNGSRDWCLIPGQVIPKTQKMILDSFLFNTQHYKECIKCKWSNPGKGVVPSPTPPCSSYWKGSLWVVLNYGQQNYREVYQKYSFIINWELIGNLKRYCISFGRLCNAQHRISFYDPWSSESCIVLKFSATLCTGLSVGLICWLYPMQKKLTPPQKKNVMSWIWH